MPKITVYVSEEVKDGLEGLARARRWSLSTLVASLCEGAVWAEQNPRTDVVVEPGPVSRALGEGEPRAGEHKGNASPADSTLGVASAVGPVAGRTLAASPSPSASGLDILVPSDGVVPSASGGRIVPDGATFEDFMPPKTKITPVADEHFKPDPKPEKGRKR